jgi:histidinol-phosphate aminotransferase
MATDNKSACRSRRDFIQLGAGAAAAGAFLATTAVTASAGAGGSALGGARFAAVWQAQANKDSGPARADHGPRPKDAVVIDANENPLGPCTMAREAAANILPEGGRYSDWLTRELVNNFAAMEGLKPEYVRAFAGSGGPLHYAVLAFSSPTRSYVTADPGYEAGMNAANIAGARLVKVPLTKTYAHDVKAMLAAAPDAGLFYVCTPNNPTGTLTGHADIELLLANKPKGAVLLVDEAYIHFADGQTSTLDLVKADKDLVVLRTFSKIYGMAGLRCGFAIARPDLLKRVGQFAGWSPMPVTAVVAATASLKHEGLVAERKRINAAARGETFEWLAKKGYAFVPSESNCFMVDAKRPAKEVIRAMAAQNVFIGRAWPVWPTHVRITVGTQAEMEKFREAFDRVMTGKVVGDVAAMSEPMLIDGMGTPEYC